MLTPEEAKGAFDSLDADHSGYVSAEEFVSFFKRRAWEIAEKEVQCTRVASLT